MNPAQRLLLRNIAAVVLVQRLEYVDQSRHRLSYLRLGLNETQWPKRNLPFRTKGQTRPRRPRCLQLKLVLLLLLGLVLHGVLDQGRCHLAAVSRSLV